MEMEQQKKIPYRRIASNELITLEGKSLTRCVVELSEDGQVIRHYFLTRELPYTEWMQGQLKLSLDDDGKVRVYYKGKPITKKR